MLRKDQTEFLVQLRDMLDSPSYEHRVQCKDCFPKLLPQFRRQCRYILGAQLSSVVPFASSFSVVADLVQAA